MAPLDRVERDRELEPSGLLTPRLGPPDGLPQRVEPLVVDMRGADHGVDEALPALLPREARRVE